MARYITSLDEDAVDIVARIHQLTTQLDDLIQHQQVKAEETVVLGESIDADEEHAARVALVLEDTVESLLGRQAVVFTELQDLSTLMDLGHSGNIDMYVGDPPSTCIPLDGSKQFFGDYPWLQVGKTGWMVEFDASTDRPWFRTVYVYAFSPRHPPEDFTMGVPIEVSDSVWAAGAEFCVYP
ncbi:MAG TPA: hypothetical protein EYP81_00875 [Thermodesulfobacteriaceae bacterium]|nr:hypothetical protein [Thermodesulfobacteriaceae bacterium]